MKRGNKIMKNNKSGGIGSTRVYEVIDGYSWKSWGPDEFRLLHSDETMF